MNAKREFVILFAIIIAVLRFAGLTHPAFQAVAHLYVGGLFAAWPFLGWTRGRFFLLTAIGLSVAEVIAFVLSLLR